MTAGSGRGLNILNKLDKAVRFRTWTRIKDDAGGSQNSKQWFESPRVFGLLTGN
jgi:hypothetical protein